jgi:localization factor PodJL
LAERTEQFSKPQLEPLQERLDEMHARLEDLATGVRASSAELGPFAQTLQDISDRVTASGERSDDNVVVERLAAIEERLAGLSARGADPRAVHNQLDNIVSRLELLKGRSIDPARLSDIFDRVDAAMRTGLADERFDKLERLLDERTPPVSREWLERLEQRITETAQGGISADMLGALRDRLDTQPAPVSDDRLARLEERLEDLGRAYSTGGEGLAAEDFGDLRGDIIALRRELRSLPGLGEGEASLGAVLKTISARLERLPEQATAASGDLDSKLERIAQLLEDPRNGGVAFAHVQQSLRTIEERLEELRRDPSPRSLDDDAQDDIGAVVGIARALSDDVGALKTTAEASERKTKDALDAVQGTLEAVVKRMAFLERDVAAPAMPVDNQDAEDRGRIVPAMLGLPVIPTLGASLDDVSEDRRPRPDFDPAAAELPLGAATKNEAPRETGGLFSRLTSSQLLKRATGGRAESFSPEGDEVEEAADQPLEPGTNAPLDSALTGAPSSDTALMSGDRHKRRAGAVAAARAAALDGPDAGSGASIGNDPSAFRRGPPEAGGDDFLSAARRAAQAAAAEVADAEREAEMLREGSVLGRMGGFLKRRRRVVLASAVAVALALAALQIVRNQMDLGPAEVASLPAAGSADAVNVSPTEELAPEPEPELTAAQPAPAEPAMPEPTPPPQAEASAPAPSTPPPSVTTPPADAESIAATGAPEAVIPSMAAEPAAPVETAALPQTLPPPPDAGLGLPSAGNIAPDAGVPTSSVPAAVPGSPADLSGLPAPIGPDRLRNAAADGDPVAAFEVGSRYAEGRGVVEDMSAAIAWYTRAAESGLAPAQYRLGSIYEKVWVFPRTSRPHRPGTPAPRTPATSRRCITSPYSTPRAPAASRIWSAPPDCSARPPITACATASSTWPSCMPGDWVYPKT